MRVLLTGASGFLGRNVILRVPEEWTMLALYRSDRTFVDFVRASGKSNVTAVQCDLSDPNQARDVFQAHGTDWDCCIYLAAKVDIPWSVREPGADLLSNVSPLLNVLEHVHASKFIYFSSGAVYDGLQGEVVPGSAVSPTIPYAISKLACERYVDFFQSRRHSIDQSLIVRFFGAYGPYEAQHKIYTRLIRSFCIDDQHTYTLYGDGMNLIDAMYVDDAVEAVQRMVTQPCSLNVVNLAAGRPITVRALAVEVAQALEISDVQIVTQGIAHESNQFWGSTAEMKECFGFEARTSLTEGIRSFRDFLISHSLD